jgi:hypothetical protein
MKHRVFWGWIALLLPMEAAAQTSEAPPPTMETRPAEPSLTPPPPGAESGQKLLEELRQKLEGTPAPEKPKAAPKEPGGLSIQRELLWEEDLEDWERARALKKERERKLLSGGIAEVHVVQRGDTLWDLSARFLNNPWLWPRVWSYNPHITNPHWIYPGQVVRFGPLPKGAEEAAAPALSSRPPPRVIPGHRLKIFRHTAFVAKEELKRLGTLENSPDEKIYLPPRSEAYVRFQKPEDAKLGERFLSARVGDEVKHPVTGDEMGRLVHITGELKITSVGSEKLFSKAVVTRAWGLVERGNVILPWENLEATLDRTPNKKNLRGYLIASVRGRFLGQYHLGFVDLGARQGVEPGNRFVVVRRGDGLERREEYGDKIKKMPVEEIGDLVILSTKPDTSTGLLRHTAIEVELGDKVEMRQGD